MHFLLNELGDWLCFDYESSLAKRLLFPVTNSLSGTRHGLIKHIGLISKNILKEESNVLLFYPKISLVSNIVTENYDQYHNKKIMMEPAIMLSLSESISLSNLWNKSHIKKTNKW